MVNDFSHKLDLPAERHEHASIVIVILAQPECDPAVAER
jgi:hypothetical protein